MQITRKCKHCKKLLDFAIWKKYNLNCKMNAILFASFKVLLCCQMKKFNKISTTELRGVHGMFHAN